MLNTQLEPATFSLNVSWIPSKHWHLLRDLCFSLVMIKVIKSELTKVRQSKDDITTVNTINRLEFRITTLEKHCNETMGKIADKNKTLETQLRTTICPQVDEWVGLDSGISPYQYWFTGLGFYAHENTNMTNKLLTALKDKIDFTIVKYTTRSQLVFYRSKIRIEGHQPHD